MRSGPTDVCNYCIRYPRDNASLFLVLLWAITDNNTLLVFDLSSEHSAPLHLTLLTVRVAEYPEVHFGGSILLTARTGCKSYGMFNLSVVWSLLQLL